METKEEVKSGHNTHKSTKPNNTPINELGNTADELLSRILMNIGLFMNKDTNMRNSVDNKLSTRAMESEDIIRFFCQMVINYKKTLLQSPANDNRKLIQSTLDSIKRFAINDINHLDDVKACRNCKFCFEGDSIPAICSFGVKNQEDLKEYKLVANLWYYCQDHDFKTKNLLLP